MVLRRTDRHPAGSWRVPLTLALLGSASALAAHGSIGHPDEAGLPDLAHPDHFQCVGKNRFSGTTSVPTERSGITTGRAYAAIFFDPVQGQPIIVYGERFQRTAPLFQSFIRRHECEHAKGVQDEILANCGALMQMRVLGLSAEQEARIAQWHVAEGTIDPQYGGTGARFWERTLGCAGVRLRLDRQVD